jgi:aryl-alcohol dehydrogenase-like predicted oxidoreductase
LQRFVAGVQNALGSNFLGAYLVGSLATGDFDLDSDVDFLAGGLLSGKYKHGDTPDKGRFSAELGGFGQTYQARYWHEREFETVARVQEIAKQHGAPITTLSVAWVLANPAITSVILGASRVEQLTDTLAAADCKLDGALKARLDEVTIEFRRGDAGK